jgi:hypothetical protein
MQSGAKQPLVECKVVKDAGDATFHKFVVVPRIGETVILQTEAVTTAYQVVTVSHLPEREASEASIMIGLMKLNA